MAETTTRPNRTRKAADKPAAKATPAKKAAATPTPKATSVQVGDDGRARVPVQLEHIGDTSNYAKFAPPKSSGCVGTFYAPLGTEEVKVLLIGPAE